MGPRQRVHRGPASQLGSQWSCLRSRRDRRDGQMTGAIDVLCKPQLTREITQTARIAQGPCGEGGRVHRCGSVGGVPERHQERYRDHETHEARNHVAPEWTLALSAVSGPDCHGSCWPNISSARGRVPSYGDGSPPAEVTIMCPVSREFQGIDPHLIGKRRIKVGTGTLCRRCGRNLVT